MEESGLGLLEVLSRNIPGETKKNDQCCGKARAELVSCTAYVPSVYAPEFSHRDRG